MPSPSTRDDEFEHGLWWVQRWVSGSMDDPDWTWDVAEATGVTRGFEAVQETVGNARSVGAPVWRYLCVPEAEAARFEEEGMLLPFEHPFQSFTSSRLHAAEAGVDLMRPGEVHVLVCVKPPETDVMFGMADLLADPRCHAWTMALDLWHHQDEVVVRVSGPMPVLECHRVDLEAELGDRLASPRF